MKATKHPMLYCVASVLTCIVSMKTQALQLSAEAGYDSNPFELSKPRSGDSYTAWRLYHKGERNFENKQTLQYTAEAQARLYDSLQNADQYQVKGRLRWINRYRLGDKSASLMVTGDLRSERQTYFSVSQRAVAQTSAGDSLEDRFDYDSGKLSAEFTYRMTRRASVSLYGYIDHRNYVEDYQSLGLESLDYTEFNLQPTIRYKSAAGGYFRLFVYHKQRDYEDLRNDGMDGKNLDSVVRYDFNGLGLYARQPLSNRWTASFYGHAYNARDNADGYRDLNYRKAEVTLTYLSTSQAQWRFVGDCYRRDYLEDSYRPPESETGDRGRLREGCSMNVTHERPLWNVEATTWQLKASHHFEDNSDDAFSFDRQTVSVGATYVF